jgi:hypothetical protein
MTSFDEVAVAVPSMQFDLKPVYPLSKLRDKVVSVSGGDVTNGGAFFSVFTTDDPDSEVTFRSVERGRYIAGFDSVPGMGLAMPVKPTGNQTIEFGYSDFENGLVIGYDANGIYSRLYKGGVAVETNRREDWVNPLFGAFDPANMTIYRMPFRWYGSGPFRIKISTLQPDGQGDATVADVLGNSGGSEPVTDEANNPIAVRIKNNGTAKALSCRVAGRQFITQGDYNPKRRNISEVRYQQSVGTEDFLPLIAMRQKSGSYKSISVRLQSVDLAVAGENIEWQIRSCATDLTGDTWVNPRFTESGHESAIEFNTTATAAGNGIQIAWGLAVAGQGNRSGSEDRDLPDLDLPGDQCPVVLCARAITGTATVTSVFTLKEEW